MVRQSLMGRLLFRPLCAVLVLLLSSCATPPPAPAEPPPAPREFRAVWVASVANIDWPSKLDLTAAQQQAEIIAIVERARQLNLNAIVLQVRTSADALYDSKLEPWSEYLTGEQGKPPEPFYDPLKMWVEEAHQRGLELHAWFNPYRARHPQAKTPNAKNHIANTHPAAVKTYGTYLWMDPGEKAASDHTLNVILDVVRRYDVDGVHIDDYFYPYPIPVPGTVVPSPSADDTPAPRVELPFPDEPAWQAYLAGGGTLSQADWRRRNVDQLIERIHVGIKGVKPWVKFGISPFGLGKPDKRPPGIVGFSQYDKLYADAELWLQKGWMDYFTPQLYWAIGQKAQAYGTLLDYWAKENTFGRHLWPGLYTSRINHTDKSWLPDEIVNQIKLTRDKGAADPLVSGHVHFSMVAMLQNRKAVNDHLSEKLYQTPALIPASPWQAVAAPAPPTLEISRDAMRPNKISVRPMRDERVAAYALWTNEVGGWKFSVQPGGGRGALMLDEMSGLPEMLVWSALNRAGIESARVTLTRRQLQAAQAAK